MSHLYFANNTTESESQKIANVELAKVNKDYFVRGFKKPSIDIYDESLKEQELKNYIKLADLNKKERRHVSKK